MNLELPGDRFGESAAYAKQVFEDVAVGRGIDLADEVRRFRVMLILEAASASSTFIEVASRLNLSPAAFHYNLYAYGLKKHARELIKNNANFAPLSKKELE